MTHSHVLSQMDPSLRHEWPCRLSPNTDPKQAPERSIGGFPQGAVDDRCVYLPFGAGWRASSSQSRRC